VRTAETEILRYEAEKSAHSWAVFLRESLPHLPEVLSGQGVREEDQRVIHSASIAGQIFRYKFFNNDGKIVHASRPNDIGQTNIKWYFLELVKKGQSYEKIEREEDFGISRKVVSEAYVPIMKAGVFAGAIEVYVDVTDRAESLHRLGNYAIAGLILLLFVIGSTMGTVVGRNIAARSRATRSAETANHIKSEFLATMSHEIRTRCTAFWERLVWCSAQISHQCKGSTLTRSNNLAMRY
jgi:hypothetical protein